MLVTEVRKITDRKNKIFLEDGTSFVLYVTETRKLRIREHEDLADETVHRIMEEILKKRACLRCMNLLRSRDRTVQELRRKLQTDGYPDEIISRALEYVASFHYTDDSRFAQNYFRQMAGRKSRKQIEFELLGKGVDRETVRAALLPDDADDMEAEAVLSLARRRGYDPDKADEKETARLFRYLMGKGFGYEVIRRALAQDLD